MKGGLSSAACCLIAVRFSMWKRNIQFPLDDYIAYCKRHQHEVDAYVSFDCIPGENGLMDHSQASIDRSAAKSYENHQIMKAEGLRPIPVFHQGETFNWLDRMLEDGETYIGISPYMKAHQSEIIKWMDRAFSRICDNKGRPLVGTHGFGVTACNLCIRYPWKSVDSTSWSVGGGYGSILVPQYIDGEADYTKPPLTLRLSARKEHSGSRGFDALPAAEQDVVRQHAANINVSMSELRNTFMGRWRFNVNYHLGLAAACNGRLFKNRTNGLFGSFAPKGKGSDPEPLKLYFATVVHTRHHNEFLNEYNITNRLLSYAFLRELPDNFLDLYRRTGLPEQKEKRVKKMSLRMLSSEAYRVRRASAIMARISRNVGQT